MQKSRVALVRCQSYDPLEVDRAMRRGLELLGGAGSFVRAGERILLKPNVLSGDPPERCTATHPEVFRAAARLFLEVTPLLSYGDSPGFGRPSVHLRKCGIGKVAEELGIGLADFETGQEVSFPQSPFTKRFYLAKGVLAADGLISLPKLKTHQFMRFTGAVKNQLGCVQGIHKAEFHVKTPEPSDFARMLVALTLMIRPRLFIMDAVMAMEGNGPRSGDPVAMNLLLLSADPVALDAAACRLIDLNPAFVPTLAAGREWGLGTFREEEIELCGDPPETFFNPRFKVERKPAVLGGDMSRYRVLKNWISPRPVIDERRCRRCGVCVEVCPVRPQALQWPGEDRKRPPVYTYKRCIRCYCCQELCPEKAISVRTPLLSRVLLYPKSGSF